MKEFTFKCWMKAQMAKQDIKNGFKSLMSEENGGADTLIIAIIIIVIVVAIAIVFRDQIGSWVTSLFNAANSELKDAANTTAPITKSTF